MSLAEELNHSITAEELRSLRSQYDIERPHPSEDTIFHYGWGCVRSADDEDIRRGIGLLSDLLARAPSKRRELRYYIAMGYFRLASYAEARASAAALLADEPQNLQARALLDEIDAKVRREGLKGVALVGAAATAVAALIAGLMMSSRKHP